MSDNTNIKMSEIAINNKNIWEDTEENSKLIKDNTITLVRLPSHFLSWNHSMGSIPRR